MYVSLEEHYKSTEETISLHFEKIQKAANQGTPTHDNTGALNKLITEEMHRDLPTRLHTERVAHYAYAIAKHRGLEEDECSLLRDATRLHDVGKRYVPQTILYSTNTQLSPKDYEKIKFHTVWGADIILDASSGPLGVIAAEIALYHHERLNGEGYHGLQGKQIPWYVLIASLADSFDVLTSQRSYNAGKTPQQAFEILQHQENQREEPSFCPESLASLEKIAHTAHEAIHAMFAEDTVEFAENEFRKKMDIFNVHETYEDQRSYENFIRAQ